MHVTRNWFIVVVFCLSVVAFMAAQPSGVSAADPVKLVYWSHWNEPEGQTQVIKSWMKAFMKRNPHITIEAVWNGRQNDTLVRYSAH